MDELDEVCCNALLHVLDKENNQPWINVYTKAGVAKSRADYLYKILNSDGFLTSLYKGDGNSIDSHVVSMTERGKAFYSSSNFVDELRIEGQFIAPAPSIFPSLSSSLLILIIAGVILFIFWDSIRLLFE
jgi:hypothetical protein